MKSPAKEEELLRAAIELARMWGVMETMEDLSGYGWEDMRKRLLQWSKEYVSSGSQDAYAFLTDKCRKLPGGP